MDENKIRQQVVTYLESAEKATMSGIAKDGLGVSKPSNTLKNIVEELVKNKTLVEDKSGKYIQYVINKKSTSSSSTQSMTDEQVTKDGEFTVTKKKDKYIVEGYTKEYELKDNQYLLVINGNPEYKVADAKDVIEAIQKYTEARGMVTFTVTNVKTGKQVTSSDDIKFTDKILILNITKVNKGGF